MKNSIIALGAMAVALSAGAAPKYSPDQIHTTALDLDRQGQRVVVDLKVDASQLKLKSNQELTVVPQLVAGDSVASLGSFTVAGRNRYYWHMRNNDATWRLTTLVHNGDDAANIAMQRSVDYRPWMEQCEMRYALQWGGCCNSPKEALVEQPFADIDMRPAEFGEQMVYVAPEAEATKTRQEKGSAFIDFVVNRTDINADYRRNPSELAKIAETIDRVRGDKDLTITSVAIKGFASPEGPYANNERLAQGRTQALMEYVRKLYTFPASVKFQTSWVAEDWAGLRTKVEESRLNDKEAILAVIDSRLEPDARDQRLRRDFPSQYRWLLEFVYPSLRHSDYQIDYVVRDYQDVAEIIAVMHTQPGKLSLSEFYLAANSLEPGSDEWGEVYEIAARMYPDDPIANINAANASMARGDLRGAQRFLLKAGDNPEADYARGVAAALQKDYTTADEYFARASSLPQSEAARAAVASLLSRPEGEVKVTMK